MASPDQVSADFFPATGDYVAAGTGTHVGRHVNMGRVITIPTGPLSADWQVVGLHVATAADGSEIWMSGGGSVQLIPIAGTIFTAAWDGEFHIEGGTGRFANVGPGNVPIQVVAVNDPFDIVNDPIWKFSWTLDGQINLGND